MQRACRFGLFLHTVSVCFLLHAAARGWSSLMAEGAALSMNWCFGERRQRSTVTSTVQARRTSCRYHPGSGGRPTPLKPPNPPVLSPRPGGCISWPQNTPHFRRPGVLHSCASSASGPMTSTLFGLGRAVRYTVEYTYSSCLDTQPAQHCSSIVCR